MKVFAIESLKSITLVLIVFTFDSISNRVHAQQNEPYRSRENRNMNYYASSNNYNSPHSSAYYDFYQQQQQLQQQRMNSHNQGAGYSAVDSRYFQHGSVQNEREGGTCAEFLRINALNQCCAHRDDDCFMIHFDTRCYCDVFCDRSKQQDNSDCCPDAGSVCMGHSHVIPSQTQTTSESSYQPETTTLQTNNCCNSNGDCYREGELFQDNCNECRCVNGNRECTQNECMININLMNEINNGHLGWQASNYSNYWGKTLDYGYKNRLGTRLPNREQRALQVDEKPILDSYDYRNEPFMVNNLRPDLIRDQGDCGASWAFSTVDVATDREAKMFEGKRGNESASIQMLISCAILPGNANGCSPASVDVAWKFIENSNKDPHGKVVGGLVNEQCWPYESGQTGTAGACKVNPNAHRIICPSDNRPFTKPLLNSSPGYQLKVESQNEIMEEIMKNGPVQAIFKVYDDFFMYKSGVYNRHPKSKVHNINDPYHSVKILGWGNENGIDYWLAANSWGENWGENGYFKIKRQDDDSTEFGRHIYAAWGTRPINTKSKIRNRYRNRNTMLRKRNRYFQRRE